MKRFTLILALILFLPCSLWAAAPGTCTQTFSEIYTMAPSTQVITSPIPTVSTLTPQATLTFTCTASADDASFPATATTQTITSQIRGRYLLEARTNPGATAPQALYDITLTDTDGIDLMGGSLADRSATASEAAYPAISTVPWPRAVDGALTHTITNNNVNSAISVTKYFLAR